MKGPRGRSQADGQDEGRERQNSEAIDKLDRFLDPVVAVRTDEGRY
jgi:hypothetical protein